MSETKPTRRAGRRPEYEVHSLATDRIEPRPQTRTTMNRADLEQLAENISIRGQLQPGAVWWDETKKIYVPVFGHRRLEACKILGIPFECRIFDHEPTEIDILDMQIAENHQRKDVNQLDQAKAFRRAMDLRGFKTNRQLAQALNVSEATVSLSLAILDLPEEAQLKISNGAGVEATLKAYRPKARRRPHMHGKRRVISLGGGRTIVLTARRPIDDTLAIEMLRAAIALIEKELSGAEEDTVLETAIQAA